MSTYMHDHFTLWEHPYSAKFSNFHTLCYNFTYSALLICYLCAWAMLHCSCTQVFIGIHQQGIFFPPTYDLSQVVYFSISDIFPSVESRNTSFHNYMCIVIKHCYQLNFVLFSDNFSNSILNSGAIHEANSQAIIGWANVPPDLPCLETILIAFVCSIHNFGVNVKEAVFFFSNNSI